MIEIGPTLIPAMILALRLLGGDVARIWFSISCSQVPFNYDIDAAIIWSYYAMNMDGVFNILQKIFFVFPREKKKGFFPQKKKKNFFFFGIFFFFFRSAEMPGDGRGLLQIPGKMEREATQDYLLYAVTCWLKKHHTRILLASGSDSSSKQDCSLVAEKFISYLWLPRKPIQM